MKTKTVKRHWCDFCNKAGLQAHAMSIHEKHCTLNPARDCRVCGLLGNSTHVGAERVAMLVAILPDPTNFLSVGWGDKFEEEHNKLIAELSVAVPKLREEVDNCPACVMAALRQRRIPIPMVENFNFTHEMKAIFDDINSRQLQERGY